MKNNFLWPLLAAALLTYVACNCPTMFPLEEETLQSPFRIDTMIVDDGVLLRFNKPVDSSSVIARKTLLVSNAKYTDYFELSQDHRELFIPQCETYCNTPMQLCPFTLRLDGDPADGMAIRSESGQVLDGDANGSDGGDFSREVNGMYDCDRYTLIVTEPVNGSSTTFSEGNLQIVAFDITFSENMDISSVKVGENVFLQCADNPAVKESGSIIWRNRYQLRFTATKSIAALRALCPPPAINVFTSYNFIIKGTGSSPVKSVYGIPVENGSDYQLKISLF